MTDEQFDEYVDQCYEELELKQGQLFEKYYLGNYESYWFDQESASLQFKNAEKVELEFEVIPIGSWSSASKSWMWSWANQSLNEKLKAQTTKLKDLANFTGFDTFESATFDADEMMAHEITAMAVHHLEALGLYILPSKNLKIFLALIQLKV